MNMSRMLIISVIVLLMVAGGSLAAVQAVTIQSQAALGNQDVEKAETGVGDLVADCVRAELNTDIALIAASELKAKSPPFPVGKLSSDDIAALVSYPDDPLAELLLTGKAVRQALDRAVSMYPQPNLGFLQVSGLEFTFDPSKNVGERVTSVTVGGAPLIDSRTYTVAVTNSMANGALGYWKVWSAGEVKYRHPNENIVKAAVDYLTGKKTIDYGSLKRITVVK
jgi:hypothetical protein